MAEENQLLLKFRAAMMARGASSIKNFSRFFLLADKTDKGNPSLDLVEFTRGVQMYNLSFSAAEIKELFGLFDKDQSGTMDFNEFLEAVRVLFYSNNQRASFFLHLNIKKH
jgi:Ca2+-binding EF-hand superfamily protein